MKNFIKLYKIKLSGKAVLKADTDERPVIRRGCEVSAGSEVLQEDWDREAKVLSQAGPSVEGAAGRLCVEWNKLGKRWESRQVSGEGNRECRDCLARRMIPGFIGREMRKNGKFLEQWCGLVYIFSHHQWPQDGKEVTEQQSLWWRPQWGGHCGPQQTEKDGWPDWPGWRRRGRSGLDRSADRDIKDFAWTKGLSKSS